MKYLLTKETDINAKNINNQTPLHIACLNKSEKLVELLLEFGADFESKNLDGDTPPFLAVKVKNHVHISCCHLSSYNITGSATQAEYFLPA